MHLKGFGLALTAGASVLLSGCAGMSASSFPSRGNLPPGLRLEETTPEGESSSKALPPAGGVRGVHPKGLELTKISEGWVPRLYNDAAGYCTIGYGHLIKKAPCNGREPAHFKPSITMAFGTQLLQEDMMGAQVTVLDAVTVTINDTQYSALVDFVFNVGAANFRKSTLLKKVNAGDFDQVPIQFRRWTLAGGQRFPGLVTRREREIALFFDGQPIPKAVPGAGDDGTPIDIKTGEPDG